MESVDAATFDESYYARYYFDKKTKVADRQHVERLGAFVSSYLKYLRVPVRRVLDVGCGMGLWRDIVARHFPQARYQGVEVSEYLCGRYGWERGSVVDYQAQEPFDFVICQGVLAYLSPVDLKRALRNLGTLSHGALYVEAVTLEDYENDIVDEDLTDPLLFRHRADTYRRGLSRKFKNLGGGVWLSRRADVPLFSLECAVE
ncbi:class I SAM-dependent methyltransferase [Variovorax sp. J22G21]|uniref:class I SAM-dependent methyltransferase n=1 Tax=Variovorax fucosicus TaxID=3053517 RepID=UPI0025772EC4|nr:MULTISPECIES: class I SAM-dependent methyltransferase [unclassified Variovorax]MDM0037499.1 class I SAM-dependent methyltransferase [Variovorax sp. J22R193]MDM0062275.1 class I SAM-dependent methyltransferase [Variovorax sp. J22G21]